MPSKPKNWLSIAGGVAALLAFLGGAFRVAFTYEAREIEDKFAPIDRMVSAELRVKALEDGQVDQDRRMSEVMHSINLHLLSLDMNVSNALQILRDHQARISALPNYETGQAKSKSGW